ncbi:MAG: DNA-3-methyladenine glycosylase [Iamia sp.]
MARRRRLSRAFYGRDPRAVAPDLLDKLLVHGPRSGRIVEVEAYAGSEDPGSHAFRGPTPRTEVMFGPPGRLYVYFSYGMHWCANVVCGPAGTAGAVLLRAVAPVTGIEAMREARPAARRDRDLSSGPARLTQALGLDGSFGGADLVTADRGVWLADDGHRADAAPDQSTRIGLSSGTDLPWRWYRAGDPNVSGRPR